MTTKDLRWPAQIESRERRPSGEYTFLDTVIANADEEDLDPYLRGGDFSMYGRHPEGIRRLMERLALAGIEVRRYTFEHPSGPPYERIEVARARFPEGST
jgi:hypothetical protein